MSYKNQKRIYNIVKQAYEIFDPVTSDISDAISSDPIKMMSNVLDTANKLRGPKSPTSIGIKGDYERVKKLLEGD